MISSVCFADRAAISYAGRQYGTVPSPLGYAGHPAGLRAGQGEKNEKAGGLQPPAFDRRMTENFSARRESHRDTGPRSTAARDRETLNTGEKGSRRFLRGGAAAPFLGSGDPARSLRGFD